MRPQAQHPCRVLCTNTIGRGTFCTQGVGQLYTCHIPPLPRPYPTVLKASQDIADRETTERQLRYPSTSPVSTPAQCTILYSSPQVKGTPDVEQCRHDTDIQACALSH